MRALVRLFSIAMVAMLCTSCGGSQPADTSTAPGAGSQTRSGPPKAMQQRIRERAAEKEQQEETQEN